MAERDEPIYEGPPLEGRGPDEKALCTIRKEELAEKNKLREEEQEQSPKKK